MLTPNTSAVNWSLDSSSWSAAPGACGEFGATRDVSQRPPRPRSRDAVSLRRRGAVVVDPADPVAGEEIEDRARRWCVEALRRGVGGEAVGRCRHQEPAVRERRSEARSEPSVGQRERVGQAPVEGQVLARPSGP